MKSSDSESTFVYKQIERDLGNHLREVILRGYGHLEHITHGVDRVQREVQLLCVLDQNHDTVIRKKIISQPLLCCSHSVADYHPSRTGYTRSGTRRCRGGTECRTRAARPSRRAAGSGITPQTFHTRCELKVQNARLRELHFSGLPPPTLPSHPL